MDDADELSVALRAHLSLSNESPASRNTTTAAVTVTDETASRERGIESSTTPATSTDTTHVEHHPDSEKTMAKAETPHKQLNQTKSTVTNNDDDNSKIEYQRWHMRDEATVDYGYLGKGLSTAVSPTDKGFYLTTAINYTNGPAHMGHAYEAVTSDVIVRCHRLLGERPVYFCTGADEHGQKIANTAAEQGLEPLEICNKYVTGFQVLNQRLLVANDEYVRTTSERHKRNARQLWQKCADAGDVYLDTYSGWYNIREETFVTDSEAALSDYKDPTSGAPLKQVQEESYFFRMSKYKDRLIQHIESHPHFIRPEQHRNLILQRLRSDDLRDLSISRTTFTWGISVPEGFDPKHVMYVWVDALSNYLTGVDALQTESTDSSLKHFWPANVHIIGKDILWFHTVIWPCLLMSAELPLPESVFAHGFVNDKEGKKMSKSLGNVVDPHDMLDIYHVDTFRWYAYN
jgi:methionyl-tRNA synthetase